MRFKDWVSSTPSDLKVRTVFNILGPLASPAAACFQVVGVSSPEIMELMANALQGLGVLHAFRSKSPHGVQYPWTAREPCGGMFSGCRCFFAGNHGTDGKCASRIGCPPRLPI